MRLPWKVRSSYLRHIKRDKHRNGQLHSWLSFCSRCWLSKGLDGNKADFWPPAFLRLGSRSDGGRNPAFHIPTISFIESSTASSLTGSPNVVQGEGDRDNNPVACIVSHILARYTPIWRQQQVAILTDHSHAHAFAKPWSVLLQGKLTKERVRASFDGSLWPILEEESKSKRAAAKANKTQRRVFAPSTLKSH